MEQTIAELDTELGGGSQGISRQRKRSTGKLLGRTNQDVVNYFLLESTTRCCAGTQVSFQAEIIRTAVGYNSWGGKKNWEASSIPGTT